MKKASKLIKSEYGATFAASIIPHENYSNTMIQFESIDLDDNKPTSFKLSDILEVREQPLEFTDIHKSKLAWKQVQSLQNWAQAKVEPTKQFA
ncbi:hypothetical protein bcgnr5372_34870 [Bacillus luti]|nr:hypothetical protein [Bacillus cereus]HDR8327297.1 hypothetical protein [Bacillus cereus]HDR8332987.1 hypothetical protein [Bacillus cereus]